MKDSRPSQPSPPGSAPEFGDFPAPAPDHGLSLEELSTAYAELLQRGSTPYDEPARTDSRDQAAQDTPALTDEAPLALPDEPSAADDDCELSPRSILEAMLFVGNSQNEPLTARQVAALMRGVRPQEIDELVQELNEQYAAEQCPYFVASVGAGYQLQLRDEFAALCENFYRRVKDAKLTQAAIDVLAIVAYKQPMTREDVDQIRGRPCGAVLSQLVRRELLRIERPASNPKTAHYLTTERFLQVFGLASLEELPDSQDEGG
jgi:segregation and condensation protein B